MIGPLCLEGKLTIITQKTNVEVYDFDFELFFSAVTPTIGKINIYACFAQAQSRIIKIGMKNIWRGDYV